MTEALEEHNERAGALQEAFRLDTPETTACKKSMKDIEDLLADTSLSCAMHLRATSDYSQFQTLLEIIEKTRDTTYRVIKTLGDPARDFEPIKRAGELLDALEIHIAMSKSVAIRKERAASIAQDLNELRASMTTVSACLDGFSAATRKVFHRLRNEQGPGP